MNVQKRKFRTRYVRIKYFEASWPEAPVAHRIEPCHGSMRAVTKKRQRSGNEVQEQVHDHAQQESQNYKSMLRDLMAMIQQYLLLSDNNKQCGALNSLKLVGSTAQQHEDYRICIWLEDVQSERRHRAPR